MTSRASIRSLSASSMPTTLRSTSAVDSRCSHSWAYSGTSTSSCWWRADPGAAARDEQDQVDGLGDLAAAHADDRGLLGACAQDADQGEGAVDVGEGEQRADEQDAGLGGDRHGQHQALPFADGELGAAGAEPFLDSVGQGHDVVERDGVGELRGSCRGDVRGDGPQQVHQGRRERLRLVGHVEELARQLGGPHVGPVECHPARCGVHVAGEQVEDLVRLGAGRRHQADHRAGRQQRRRGRQRDARRQPGGDALQGQSGRSAGCRARCVGRQHDAVGQVEHVVEPVLARGRQLHVADPRRQRLEPADGALDVQQGGGDAGQVLAAQGEGEDHDDDEAGERGCVGREDEAADDDALLVGAVLDHLGRGG